MQAVSAVEDQTEYQEGKRAQTVESSLIFQKWESKLHFCLSQCDNISICVCVSLPQPVSVAVGLESLAAQHVDVARPVPGSLMVRRPDKGAFLML